MFISERSTKSYWYTPTSNIDLSENCGHEMSFFLSKLLWFQPIPQSTTEFRVFGAIQ